MNNAAENANKFLAIPLMPLNIPPVEAPPPSSPPPPPPLAISFSCSKDCFCTSRECIRVSETTFSNSAV